jgi:hypothetical protein
MRFMSVAAASGAAAPNVAAIYQGVVRAIFLIKLKVVAACMLGVAVLGGAGVGTYRALALESVANAQKSDRPNETYSMLARKYQLEAAANR